MLKFLNKRNYDKQKHLILSCLRVIYIINNWQHQTWWVLSFCLSVFSMIRIFGNYSDKINQSQHLFSAGNWRHKTPRVSDFLKVFLPRKGTPYRREGANSTEIFPSREGTHHTEEKESTLQKFPSREGTQHVEEKGSSLQKHCMSKENSGAFLQWT